MAGFGRGKSDLQLMGLFRRGNRETSPPTRGGSETAVNQPENFEVWCNCVAVTQDSRGLPLRGGGTGAWLGGEEEIGGCPVPPLTCRTALHTPGSCHGDRNPGPGSPAGAIWHGCLAGRCSRSLRRLLSPPR